MCSLKKKIFFNLFLTVLGLYCCSWAAFSCSKWGYSLVLVHGLLVAVASLVVEPGR